MHKNLSMLRCAYYGVIFANEADESAHPARCLPCPVTGCPMKFGVVDIGLKNFHNHLLEHGIGDWNPCDEPGCDWLFKLGYQILATHKAQHVNAPVMAPAS
jgi:hypothetical protein